MRTIEISARTVEEAKQLAAEKLQVSADQIEIEILEEGGKGFLGRSKPTLIKATTEAEPVTSEREESAPPSDVPSNENQAEWVLTLLRNALSAAKLDATPKLISGADDEINIELSGEDVAILIGKHGQTIDALQYLMGVALGRAFDTRLRVTLDAEGYARRVKEMGEEAVLDPQAPRDRRIVHMALADDPDVYTYSEGDGYERHVVISPRK